MKVIEHVAKCQEELGTMVAFGDDCNQPSKRRVRFQLDAEHAILHEEDPLG